jgi:hypothetical protein
VQRQSQTLLDEGDRITERFHLQRGDFVDTDVKFFLFLPKDVASESHKLATSFSRFCSSR